MFINGLLKEVEQAGLGVELSDGSTIGGMLFADDFVGVSTLNLAVVYIMLSVCKVPKHPPPPPPPKQLVCVCVCASGEGGVDWRRGRGTMWRMPIVVNGG